MENTSSNQIDKSYEKLLPKEEVFIPTYSCFYKIHSVNKEESSAKASLGDISKYGTRIICEKRISGEAVLGSVLDMSIFTDVLQYSRKLSGVIRWEKRSEKGWEYGIQFDEPIHLDLFRAIHDSLTGIKIRVESAEPKTPHQKALSIVFQTKEKIQSIQPLLSQLESSLNDHEYAVGYNLKEEIYKSVFLLLSPIYNFLKEKTNELYHELDPVEINYNFSYLREELQCYLFLDPFVKRATTKPLGYAGDFEMMDAIYRDTNEGTNLLGKSLHKCTLNLKSAQAVFHRQNFFYRTILDRLRNKEGKLCVLSVACGPAREMVTLINEADQSTLDKLTIYLLDQDPRAITEAKHGIRIALLKNHKQVDFHCLNVEIARFAANPGKFVQHTGIDLIYSAGLFDYIKMKTAQKICSHLYSILNPTGEIFLGNFSDASDEIGIMEVMDWSLIYRSDEELLKFADSVQGPKTTGVIDDVLPQKFFYLLKSADSKN
ncbi:MULTISPECIES: PilZ domain-containing protein [unclassified Leptospira]|uniref:PilZ domain-containing protein n=1 Tax=unclassified Leptospira TaxID=2633828 RepID=UPI0002BFBAF3|nr:MULTISPECIES: PilZ domain-containing protein [unclassified Leptospira]EMJ97834.1 methyltransferase domain protein [Leptospira sp. B5-022]MCR1795654.1 PilZ domain-containing protein [Leptospira sp. id769339]